MPEPSGDELPRAISSILPYLLSFRSRLSNSQAGAAVASASASSSASPSVDAEAAAAGGGWGSAASAAAAAAAEGLRPGAWEGAAGVLAPGSSGDGCSALAMLLDTSLLRALLALPDSGALLR